MNGIVHTGRKQHCVQICRVQCRLGPKVSQVISDTHGTDALVAGTGRTAARRTARCLTGSGTARRAETCPRSWTRRAAPAARRSTTSATSPTTRTNSYDGVSSRMTTKRRGDETVLWFVPILHCEYVNILTDNNYYSVAFHGVPPKKKEKIICAHMPLCKLIVKSALGCDVSFWKKWNRSTQLTDGELLHAKDDLGKTVVIGRFRHQAISIKRIQANCETVPL